MVLNKPYKAPSYFCVMTWHSSVRFDGKLSSLFTEMRGGGNDISLNVIFEYLEFNNVMIF